METGPGHLVVVVELDGDLGVALDARHRVNDDVLHGGLLSRTAHGISDWGRGPPAIL